MKRLGFVVLAFLIGGMTFAQSITDMNGSYYLISTIDIKKGESGVNNLILDAKINPLIGTEIIRVDNKGYYLTIACASLFGEPFDILLQNFNNDGQGFFMYSKDAAKDKPDINPNIVYPEGRGKYGYFRCWNGSSSTSSFVENTAKKYRVSLVIEPYVGNIYKVYIFKLEDSGPVGLIGFIAPQTKKN